MPGYITVHNHVRYFRGKASDHKCVDCGQSARDWSYEGGCSAEKITEKPDKFAGRAVCPHPEHYSPRCRGCHMKHDRYPTASPKLDDDEVTFIRENYYTMTCLELSKRFGVNQKSITNAAFGKTYKDNPTPPAVRDVKAGGRKPFKMTDDDVREVRRLWASREATQQELADRYKVSKNYICRVVNNRYRKDVSP